MLKIGFPGLDKILRRPLDIILPAYIKGSIGGSDHQSDYYTRVGIPATIINKSLNVNCITAGKLIVDNLGDVLSELSWPLYKVTFLREELYIKFSSFLKVKSNDMVTATLHFGLSESDYFSFLPLQDSGSKYRIELSDIRGNYYTSQSFTLDF